MRIIFLCITLVLSFTPVSSDKNMSQIKVFPEGKQSIAGVIQVSHLNERNLVEYGFDAFEARSLCRALGLEIASKSQVETALSRGLETCRFGWTDEHLAVIPRINALANCGKSQIGLVPWRASVTQKFDAFCFNKSGAATQLKDATTDSPLSTSSYPETSLPPSKDPDGFLTTWAASFSSSLIPLSPSTLSYDAEPARFVSSTHSSTGAKVVLITCTCGLLLITVAVLAYIKLTRKVFLGSDKKQQQEGNIQTEEWISVKNITETTRKVQEDQTIHVD
ncbi:lymphatic vessel endothelial hyaluronic acid receptor 1a [Nematolebias whitei]|uniref:lymphatic vessel endothelial hyaluronic acid receptor 1a n=1 Tax=Nematolebias whitei TaxID=451745 RepID=UPI00189AF2F8|nr:lymphatic vessel endothelial hyaluronic acid receptor 1a [Nematolebias whitei]